MKNLALYEAASQVIPVLFIVLLLEARLFAPGPDKGWIRWPDRLFNLTLLILIASGEAFALHALDVGHASSVTRWFVLQALIVEGIGIVVFALRGHRLRELDQRIAALTLAQALAELRLVPPPDELPPSESPSPGRK